MVKIHVIDQDTQLYIGQSAKENTELVENSNPDEYWFHFLNISSASAVLKTKNFKKRYLKIVFQIFIDHHNKGFRKIIYCQIKDLIICDTPGLFIPRKYKIN